MVVVFYIAFILLVGYMASTRNRCVIMHLIWALLLSPIIAIIILLIIGKKGK